MRPSYFLKIIIAILLLSLAVTLFGSLPSDPDAQGTGTASIVPGEVIFDSNRSGTFGVYALNPENGAIRTLVTTDMHEMYPDPSPDGKWVVFARSDASEDGNSSIWIVDRNGSEERLLVENGTFPTFSVDGTKVFFERDQKSVMSISLASKKLTKVFPARARFKNFLVVKPRISPDERWVAFTSNKLGFWNAWVAPVEPGKAIHINQGCEPTWIPDSEQLYWVKRHGSRAMAGIYTFSPTTREKKPFEDRGDPFGHEYFPTAVDGEGALLFAACPGDQHSHITANYELFVRTAAGERIQLTTDGYTNRWPKVLRY